MPKKDDKHSMAYTASSLSLWRKQNLLRGKRTACHRGTAGRGAQVGYPISFKNMGSELLRSINDKHEIKTQGRESLKVWDFNTGLCD